MTNTHTGKVDVEAICAVVKKLNPHDPDDIMLAEQIPLAIAEIRRLEAREKVLTDTLKGITIYSVEGTEDQIHIKIGHWPAASIKLNSPSGAALCALDAHIRTALSTGGE